MNQVDTYRVLLDERWALEDLHKFPRAFSQAYSFIYCFDSKLELRRAERIDDALKDYPWRGGYSYVNIYTVLYHQLPREHRPEIESIHYASPGWIDIALNPDVALQIAKSVAFLSGSAVAIAQAFKRIDKIRLQIARQRGEDRLQGISLSAREVDAIHQLCEEAAKNLGFKNIKALHRRTGDPEVTLKLLMAHYRRLEIMTEYVSSGKVALPIKLKEKN